MPSNTKSPFKPIANAIAGEVDKFIATPVAKVVKGVDSVTRPLTSGPARLIGNTIKGVEDSVDKLTGAKGGKKAAPKKKTAPKKKAAPKKK